MVSIFFLFYLFTAPFDKKYVGTLCFQKIVREPLSKFEKMNSFTYHLKKPSCVEQFLLARATTAAVRPRHCSILSLLLVSINYSFVSVCILKINSKPIYV